jgi:ketosteroid isomerase-like protein
MRRAQSGSELRRRLVYWQIKRAFAAMARSDVELVQLYYEPDAEVWMKGMEGVGVNDCYRGREGVRMLYADIDDAWADWSWTIKSIADGGDRVAIRGDFVGYGRRSGVKTDVSDGGTAVAFSARVWGAQTRSRSCRSAVFMNEPALDPGDGRVLTQATLPSGGPGAAAAA